MVQQSEPLAPQGLCLREETQGQTEGTTTELGLWVPVLN